jgi:hypothetical protein
MAAGRLSQIAASRSSVARASRKPGHVFVFEERGVADIRGIGLTRTYFLIGPRVN